MSEKEGGRESKKLARSRKNIRVKFSENLRKNERGEGRIEELQTR